MKTVPRDFIDSEHSNINLEQLNNLPYNYEDKNNYIIWFIPKNKIKILIKQANYNEIQFIVISIICLILNIQ